MQPSKALRAHEIQAIQSLLDFSNQPSEQVRERSRRKQWGQVFRTDEFGKVVAWTGSELPELHEHLRRWLGQLVSKRRSHSATSLAAMRKAISDGLVDLSLRATVSFRDGALQIAIAADDLSGHVYLAMAYLLDDSRGLGRSLRRCDWQRCGKFFLDLPTRGRRKKRFCTTAHGSAFRQAKYRRAQEY